MFQKRKNVKVLTVLSKSFHTFCCLDETTGYTGAYDTHPQLMDQIEVGRTYIARVLQDDPLAVVEVRESVS